jgi:CHAD domain-containing protein
MRVTTWRLRSTLRGFSRILDAEATRPINDELKWLAAQLADERDTEVLVRELCEDVRALPRDMIIGPVGADLDDAARQRAEEGARTIAAALDSPRYQALQDTLDKLIAEPPLTHRAERPARAELSRDLAKAVRRLDRQVARVLAAEPGVTTPGARRNAALHKARKADRRVRYMSQLLIPLYGTPAQRLHHQAEKLQQLLDEYRGSVMSGAHAHLKVTGPAHRN